MASVIRKEVLQEKREMEARLRREAIERQELMITVAGILVLLLFSAVGSALYLNYMGWLDIRIILDDLCLVFLHFISTMPTILSDWHIFG